MTKADQKRIVREMCAGIKKTMLEACDTIPLDTLTKGAIYA